MASLFIYRCLVPKSAKQELPFLDTGETGFEFDRAQEESMSGQQLALDLELVALPQPEVTHIKIQRPSADSRESANCSPAESAIPLSFSLLLSA